MAAAMTFPVFFKPSATDDLIRVGSATDGGYVMPARILDHSTALLSMGLSDDWSFEEAVHSKTGAPLVVFDHSVDGRFWVRRFAANLIKGVAFFDRARLSRVFRFVGYYLFFNSADRRHVQKAIGSAPGFVDLKDALGYLNADGDILLKVDIEEGEYSIFDQIIANRARFSAIVMELHLVQKHEAEIEQFMADLSGDFILTHFHANNFAGEPPFHNSQMVEISLMSRRLLKPGEKTAYRPLPIEGLDAPSAPGASDITPHFA